MQSESQDQYPLVSFEYLNKFCLDTNLVDVKFLEETVTTPKPEDETIKAKEDEDDELKNAKKIRKVDSEFESMNRSRFLSFLIWACKKS